MVMLNGLKRLKLLMMMKMIFMVHRRNVLRDWISSTVKIPERVDVTGSKKKFFWHFFYSYARNDNVYR